MRVPKDVMEVLRASLEGQLREMLDGHVALVVSSKAEEGTDETKGEPAPKTGGILPLDDLPLMINIWSPGNQETATRPDNRIATIGNLEWNQGNVLVRPLGKYAVCQGKSKKADAGPKRAVCKSISSGDRRLCEENSRLKD